ncbi:lateral organ boundaries domain-containing protein [Cynara cardunculus var. scolymus]|uniref:Lateral organ boundaries domain-containing protein n=1 Tax=Cynara cardunculus var. scolymus TaxID=59895 RepID=A0A103YA31_CYNCS|nr:lateral organ boundaries domain-containing protein [Cynara cardunculus var. scolymus]
MSCNGCRVLRKGCNDNCILRPCLSWIISPQSQANATLFLAKFYGRAGLFNLINASPDHLRPDIFRSLLHEACGRIINPTYGSVGLLWSGNWEQCQAAVDSVLQGSPIMQLPTNNHHDVAVAVGPQNSMMPLEGCDIRHLYKDPNSHNHRAQICKRFNRPNDDAKEPELGNLTADGLGDEGEVWFGGGGVRRGCLVVVGVEGITNRRSFPARFFYPLSFPPSPALAVAASRQALLSFRSDRRSLPAGAAFFPLRSTFSSGRRCFPSTGADAVHQEGREKTKKRAWLLGYGKWIEEEDAINGGSVRLGLGVTTKRLLDDDARTGAFDKELNQYQKLGLTFNDSSII